MKHCIILGLFTVTMAQLSYGHGDHNQQQAKEAIRARISMLTGKLGLLQKEQSQLEKKITALKKQGPRLSLVKKEIQKLIDVRIISENSLKPLTTI